MKDVIAVPYRERLLPGFRQARQVVAEIGAVASGSRPARPCSLDCDKPDTAQRVATGRVMNLQNQEGFVHICRWIRRAHETGN
ncbi:hypothetical protein ACLK1S_00020 [Escherichia coli]